MFPLSRGWLSPQIWSGLVSTWCAAKARTFEVLLQLWAWLKLCNIHPHLPQPFVEYGGERRWILIRTSWIKPDLLIPQLIFHHVVFVDQRTFMNPLLCIQCFLALVKLCVYFLFSFRYYLIVQLSAFHKVGHILFQLPFLNIVDDIVV